MLLFSLWYPEIKEPHDNLIFVPSVWPEDEKPEKLPLKKNVT